MAPTGEAATDKSQRRQRRIRALPTFSAVVVPEPEPVPSMLSPLPGAGGAEPAGHGAHNEAWASTRSGSTLGQSTGSTAWASARSSNTLEQGEGDDPEAVARAMDLFWSHAHRLFDGFPVLRNDIPEPVVGGPAGERHVVGEQLGFGSFGSVHLAEAVRAGEAPAALKVIPKEGVTTLTAVRLLATEVGILTRLSHPSVVQMLDVMHTPKNIMLLMEYAGPENLFSAQAQEPSFRFTPVRAAELFAQIVAGVAHCHSRGVAHRDLKPENVVLSADGLVAKVVDFGAASALTAECELHGTVPFMAPEVMAMQAHRYNAAKADVWSLGVMLLEMLCGLNCLPDTLGWRVPCVGKPALATDLELFLAYRGPIGCMLELRCRHLPVSLDLEDLIHHMLSLSVRERYAADDVLRSTWLAQSAAPSGQVENVQSTYLPHTDEQMHIVL